MNYQTPNTMHESDSSSEFFASQAHGFPTGRGFWLLLVCSAPVAVWLFLL